MGWNGSTVSSLHHRELWWWEGAGAQRTSRLGHPPVGGPDSTARPERDWHSQWVKGVHPWRRDCSMRKDQNSSEDGSHRSCSQPAGLRRCWNVAAVLSPAPWRAVRLQCGPPMHPFCKEPLSSTQKGGGLFQEGWASPSAAELTEAELGGEGGGCGMTPSGCPALREALEEKPQAQLTAGFKAGTVFPGVWALPRNPVSSRKLSSGLARGRAHGRSLMCGT